MQTVIDLLTQYAEPLIGLIVAILTYFAGKKTERKKQTARLDGALSQHATPDQGNAIRTAMSDKRQSGMTTVECVVGLGCVLATAAILWSCAGGWASTVRTSLDGAEAAARIGYQTWMQSKEAQCLAAADDCASRGVSAADCTAGTACLAEVERVSSAVAAGHEAAALARQALDDYEAIADQWQKLQAKERITKLVRTVLLRLADAVIVVEQYGAGDAGLIEQRRQLRARATRLRVL